MRVAICDDNREDCSSFGNRIKECARKHGMEAEVTEYDTAQQLMFAFSDAKDAADLLFLDINMPGMNGIDAANELRHKGYEKDIVFLTVSEQHMLQAFDVGAFNYIVKNNTSEERFDRVVSTALESAKRNSTTYIMLSAGGDNRNIPIDEIRYFEMINRIIHVYYGNETFEFFSSMGKLENRLEKYGFIRIHRSYLVSTACIRTFSYSEVVMDGGEKLPLSRGKYNLLKEKMENQAEGEQNDAV